MTWTSFHNRGETLRTVMAAADERRDGLLPMDVDGVADHFDDEFDLLAALQLKWHTRLASRIERELMDQPMDLESAVVDAWQLTVADMPGVRAILDHYRAEPLDSRMADAMAKSLVKEHLLLAAMAGRTSYDNHVAVPVGAEIEERARASMPPFAGVGSADRRATILERLRAVIAA